MAFLFLNSVHVTGRWEIHWPCTFSGLEAQRKQRGFLLTPLALSCLLSHSIWVICPIQKHSHVSPKKILRRSVLQWHLGSRSCLVHAYNLCCWIYFMEPEKNSYKAVFMSLAGLAEEFYNVSAPLATFFLSHRSLHPLCHSWETEMPGSHPPLQLTPVNMGLNCWQTGEQQNLILELRIGICSPWPAWLWIQSAGWRNGR